MAYNLFIILM